MLILLCIWSSKSVNCSFVMAPKKARGISMEVVVHQESEARCQTESSQHRKGTSSSKTQGDTFQSNGSGTKY